MTASSSDPGALPYSLRARLTVIAPSLAEVVRYVGGWLFDQAMAGWEVAVLTADHGDPRPLRILGARAYDLDTVLAGPLPGRCLQAIAVQADLYRSDARVRQMVDQARDLALTDVRLWGGDGPDNLGSTADPVQHPLSAAARAFKAHALAAASVPADVTEDPEVFRRAGSGTGPTGA